MMRALLITFLVGIAGTLAEPRALASGMQGTSGDQLDPIAVGRRRFQIRCSGCHGADGTGGERAPAIGHGDRSRLESDSGIRDVIRSGIPEAGMPAFDVPPDELDVLVAFVRSRVLPASRMKIAGDAKAGADYFFGSGGCSNCHMMRGQGGLTGPDLTQTGDRLTLGEIEASLRRPDSRRLPGYTVVTARLRSGELVRGFLRNETGFDLQIQGFDSRLHLVDATNVAQLEREPHSYMPKLDAPAPVEQNLLAFLANPPASVPRLPDREALPGAVRWSDIIQPKQGEWPTYHGDIGGNRYSPLGQITPENVSRLAPKWVFPIPGSRSLEVTPVVVAGVMYVTTVNTAYALDARTGRQIWQYSRPRSKGLVGDAAGGINRGVAVLGDRVFLVTDNAHLLALHRLTGALLWDIEMADSRQHYGSTSAPLIVKDLVVAGVSGGDEGIRGFLSAYRAETGDRVWRFWTVPAPGEPLAKTWGGRAIEHPCAATWLTGTYDPELDLLFWPTGNPCPDFNGDEREGDNLYADSVVALKPDTGDLSWYYQFTPHDLHDWDATETPMVVDAEYQGRRRQLLLQGNRNGFFYVLDRTDGKLLSATPFVTRLTWAKGIGKDGRPILAEGWQPTVEGTQVCPSMDGATNWMSTAYNASTGLFYLLALEKCNVYTKSSEWWKQGESFYGGSVREAHDEPPRKYLRAIDLKTGKIAWEYAQTGPGQSWGGLLSTASGLIFFGDDNGAFTAVDAQHGKPLWHFQLGAHWKASPMTYLADGKQLIGVAAGGSIIVFGIP
jgi:PQQ-dependent dehydrogenase (methanol/ethanol family)